MQSTLVEFAAALNTSLVPPGFDRYLRIVHSDQGGDAGPLEGKLSRDEATALVAILANSSPDQLWHVAVWDGYSQFTPPWPYCPDRLAIPSRRYHVASGELNRLVPDWYDRPFNLLREPVPNIWWPFDHSAFVHSEIDFTVTYVGCSKPVASQISASSVLDAELVEADVQLL